MLNIDFNQVEDSQDFELLPAGDYVAIVAKAELRSTGAGGAGISCQFEIIEGPMKGRYVFDWINVEHPTSQACVKIGLQQLKKLVIAAQIDTSKPFTDPQDLVGSLVVVKVGFGKDKDTSETRNKVKGFMPVAKAHQSDPSPRVANMAAGQRPNW